ncbi:hypothetical protein [Methylobacterium oryzisoli]|uniref:hypothetical protein n=1 Tax=Methylobacterium oryzisoli TaxID=3385502 RepID=UPI0038914466
MPLRLRVELQSDGSWTITSPDAPGWCVRGITLHDAFSRVGEAVRDLGQPFHALMPSPC